MSSKKIKDIELYLKVKKKLDPFKVCSILGVEPHPTQAEVLEIISEGNFNVLSLVNSRRWGKSFIVSKIAVTDLLAPNSSVLVVAPVFQNAKAIFDAVYQDILKLKIEIVKKDTKGLSLQLSNGSKIMVVSSKNFEAALGQRFSLVIFEESQSIDNLISIWEDYLMPAQADFGVDENGYMNSKTIFIGTARDKSNDFYEIFMRAKKPDKYKGYISKTYTIYDNPYISESFIESRKKELDEVTFNREFMGIWSDLSDELVYYSFREDKNVIPHSQAIKRILPENQFLVGIDAGYSDSTAFLIAGVEPLTGTIIVLGEYEKNKLPLESHVNSFKALEEEFGPTRTPLRWCDPSAPQFMLELAYQFNYVTAPAYNKIEEGVQYVNQRFHQGKLLISDRCQELIEQIQFLVWQNPVTKTVKRDEKHKHFDLALAALRYMVASWDVQGKQEILTMSLD
jgi:hypothetical protein